MPSPKGVAVKLDKDRRLRYTTAAMVRLEEKTGLASTEVAERMAAGSIKTIVAVIWAGLLHEDSGLTPGDVEEIVELDRLEEIGDAVSKAFEGATGSGGEPEKGGQPTEG